MKLHIIIEVNDKNKKIRLPYTLDSSKFDEVPSTMTHLIDPEKYIKQKIDSLKDVVVSLFQDDEENIESFLNEHHITTADDFKIYIRIAE